MAVLPLPDLAALPVYLVFVLAFVSFFNGLMVIEPVFFTPLYAIACIFSSHAILQTVLLFVPLCPHGSAAVFLLCYALLFTVTVSTAPPATMTAGLLLFVAISLLLEAVPTPALLLPLYFFVLSFSS